ncbi:hypothetical protein CBS101457_002993 [Exobasidium rhododendri]|nr:hypothetical protein CBS101457_002993 [Exobasidium rhododendri]
MAGLSSLGKLDDSLTTYPAHLDNIDFRTRFNFMVTFLWSIEGTAYLNMCVPPQVPIEDEDCNVWTAWRDKIAWIIESAGAEVTDV